ncbi:tetratricopeptide repeat protein [Kitasatospora sp. NPDC059646]|uniref:tetratricopeptide repeat protein n=1 Tax=Kitasatospora sp. NPDC059646 TaxID=3346893 RepID=UPI00368C8537
MNDDRMTGRADGHGRVYQALGDLHIVEHHHTAPAWSGPDSVRRPAVGHTPRILRDRIELMDRLRTAVEPGQGDRVYVLHGLGGTGKTAVAHALFEHVHAQRERIGLWVNASDATTLRAGMLAVAADRGAADTELAAARSGLRAGADLVWDRLDRSDRPWLLVLDNADDPTVLAEGGWLRTSPRGIVLVTTRQAATRWWPGAELCQVGVLPREDAAAVLRDLAPESGSAEDAAQVADRLGRLPLALTLAGSFLAHQVLDPWTLADYDRSLTTGEGLAALDGATGLADRDGRHLLHTTWQLSLDALAAQGLPDAGILLRLLACWGADPLPLRLLADADLGPDLPRHRVDPALRGLLDHSLTELDHSGVRALRTHALVLDSVARNTPAAQRDTLTAVAAARLDALVPQVARTGPHDPQLALLAPHFLALLRRAELPEVLAGATASATRLADALFATGEYLMARDLAGGAADIAVERLGAEHPAVLGARYRQAAALFRLGDYAASERIHRDVLTARRRLLGEDHPDTLTALFGLCFPLLHAGRRPEGLDLLRQTAARRAEILGAGNQDTLQARAYLLEYLPMDALRAELAADDLPRTCIRELGADHDITWTARHNHTWALWAVGRHPEADPLAAALLADYEREKGPSHPITVNARMLYARTRFDTGNRDQAIELMEAVVAGRLATVGAEHPATARSREVLAEFRAGRRGWP